MENENKGSTAAAGGFFIFVGLLAGVGIGAYYGETSIGMISGFAAGVVAAIILWLLDRAGQNRK